MPSASLLRWQNDRMPRLQHVEGQCAAVLAAVPPNPPLIDESLRGCVLLLSAHFQGFCRDLYTESSQVVVSKVRPTLQALIETQFAARCFLDHGNPNIDNLVQDFKRFGFDLKAKLAADPANVLRLQHLSDMNKWRNVAAHQSTSLPPGGPLTLALLQAWRTSCDGLATALDDAMYNHLRRILRRKPW